LNITESLSDEHSSSTDGRSSAELVSRMEEPSSLHKKQSLTLSISLRLEGLAVVILAFGVLVFLATSVRTLYQFPVPDSFYWYGNETGMLLAWKNLLLHGRMTVPIALGSQLLSSPGLLLGSPWLAAAVYGVPLLIVPGGMDIVNVGRVVSFVLGVGTLVFLSWTAYRLGVKAGVAVLAIALLATTRSFTFATHSARYDIITGLGLLMFVGIMACLLPATHMNGNKRRWNHNLIFFLIGCSGVVLTFGISPHLEALLPLVMLYPAWRLGAFRSQKATIAFVSGGVLATLLLVAFYVISNHSFSIAGGISTDNQFGFAMSNRPLPHLFSWSAQRHELWAKGFYLWHEAPLFAFVFPFIIVSEATLLLKKRPHPVTSFVTICLILALVVALFVQGTQPYYLVHLLPLIALAFALHLEAWSKLSWSAPIIAIASLALCVVIVFRWTPELAHAGRMGKQIDEANTAAIQAAIEATSRDWEPDSTKPLVLAQGPAIHELLRDTILRVMSESFIFFPIRQDSPDTIMAHAGVAYVFDYDKPMTPEYETAVRCGKPIFTRVGPLLDRTVDYFNDSVSELDTLTMYQLDTSK
jgi:hypothetical protein